MVVVVVVVVVVVIVVVVAVAVAVALCLSIMPRTIPMGFRVQDLGFRTTIPRAASRIKLLQL